MNSSVKFLSPWLMHVSIANQGLERFLLAQKDCYERARRELANGQKRSCWIWFIFPQILMEEKHVSESHKIYAINSLAEASAYLQHPILGARLTDVTELVLAHKDIPINHIMGWSLDAMKFKSSMTLFSLVSPAGSVFHRALDVFFDGSRCPITLKTFAPSPLGEDTKGQRRGRLKRCSQLRKLAKHDDESEPDSPIELEHSESESLCKSECELESDSFFES
jgi:uncharacterized protein (DUF1810 family)